MAEQLSHKYHHHPRRESSGGTKPFNLTEIKFHPRSHLSRKAGHFNTAFSLDIPDSAKI